MRVVKIKDPIYYSRTIVILGTDNELKSYLDEHYKTRKESCLTPLECGNDGHTYRLDNFNEGCHTLILIDTERPEKTYSILAHELIHAVYHILRDRGITISDHTEEVVAYFYGYLFERITNELNKLVLEKKEK